MKALDYDGLDHVVDKIYDLVNSGGSADYIVEQGTSGIWTYRKWASGVAECWGKKTYPEVSINGNWGNMYTGYQTPSYETYPSGLFVSAPECTISYDTIGYNFWIATRAEGDQGNQYRTPSWQYVRSTSGTGAGIFSYHAKGFWKEFTPSVSARVNNGYYQATGSSGTLSLANGTITQIPLVSTDAVSGGESIFSISDGGIKVSKSGNYRISGSVMAEATNAVYNCGCYIKVGASFASSSEVLNSNIGKDIASGPQFGVTTGSKIITLSENDIVYLCARVQGGTGTAYKQHVSTYLLVEKV